jgi:hypothetical protein
LGLGGDRENKYQTKRAPFHRSSDFEERFGREKDKSGYAGCPTCVIEDRFGSGELFANPNRCLVTVRVIRLFPESITTCSVSNIPAAKLIIP